MRLSYFLWNGGSALRNFYAKPDAEGAIDEITVEAVLKQEREGQEIRDVSDLEEIKNTQGEEEYRKEAGNVIVWENQGMDIHYKGKSGSRELVGQSGRVKIRFDYENHTVEGEDFVPFMVMSACVLPEEVFSNIEVEFPIMLKLRRMLRSLS